jgi:hypothetical protein
MQLTNITFESLRRRANENSTCAWRGRSLDFLFEQAWEGGSGQLITDSGGRDQAEESYAQALRFLMRSVIRCQFRRFAFSLPTPLQISKPH